MMEVIYSKERNKMITRINFVKDENGEIVFQNKEDIPKNWVVECKENLLVAVGLSKANPKRERITLFPVKEGSLFLHNSSFDYYCYFRDKELQKNFRQVWYSKNSCNRAYIIYNFTCC